MKTKQMMLLLCIWVLWGNMMDKQGFQPLEAYTTKGECMQEQAASEKAYPAPKSFRCLPDTMDPRGVKGGKP